MKLVLTLPEYDPKRITLLHHLREYGYTWNSGRDLTTYRPHRFEDKDNALIIETISKTITIRPNFSRYHYEDDIVIEVL